MDMSKIAMVDFFISREVFDEYEVDGSESIICVSLPDLAETPKEGQEGRDG